MDERTVIHKEFQFNLSNRKMPLTKDILRVKSSNAVLKNRSVAMIRTWIHNYISGKVKKLTL